MAARSSASSRAADPAGADHLVQLGQPLVEAVHQARIVGQGGGPHPLEAQGQVGSAFAQVGQRGLGHRDRLLPLAGQREHAGQLERGGVAQYAIGGQALGVPEMPDHGRLAGVLFRHAQLEGQPRPQLAPGSLAQRAGEVGDSLLGRSAGQRPGRSLPQLLDHLG
jgi:hypothetical protein